MLELMPVEGTDMDIVPIFPHISLVHGMAEVTITGIAIAIDEASRQGLMTIAPIDLIVTLPAREDIIDDHPHMGGCHSTGAIIQLPTHRLVRTYT